jgi:valyl-tRNA synthetase
MLFAGLHLTGTVPFRDVYIHGLIRDKNGQKMSKTKGNVVDPLDVIDRWGADAYRMTLVNFSAQGRDILWDEKRVEAFHRFETKIWQALRFCFLTDGGYDSTAPMDPGPYEHWIAARTGAAVARVREALDGYKFNEAAGEITAFVWGEYCDWYLELSKATLYDENASAARKNAVQHILFTTMGAIARMLHPIMPFLTEEIWSRLPRHDGFVAMASYPRVEDYPWDFDILKEVALVQELITEVRRIRADMELSPKVELEVHMGDAGILAQLQGHSRAIRDLARSTLKPLVERPRGFATAVVRGCECAIPLQGIVDFTDEVKRLDKVLAKVEKDAVDLERRLANSGFVERAPVEVVDEMRAKLETAVKRRDTLRGSRQRLAEALS